MLKVEPQIQRRSKRRGHFRRATVNFEIRSRPWAHHYRKEKNNADKLDRTRAEERKTKDLLMEYYCKSLYSPERGWFFRIRENEEERSKVKLSGSKRNERELFLTNECMNVQLKDVKGTTSLEIRSRPWGHHFRKENTTVDILDWARAEDRKSKSLPIEYYCKSLYSPERGGFFSLPRGDIGRGSGSSCKIREDEEEILKTKLKVQRQLPVNIKPKFYTIKDDTLLRKKKRKGRTNFSEWKEKVEFTLGVLDLDLALRQDEPGPVTDESTEEEYQLHKAWERANRLSIMFLRMTIASNIKSSLPAADKAKAYLAAIEERFKTADKSLAGKLMADLTTMKHDGTRSMHEHCIEMINLAAKLKNLGLSVDDSFLVQFILNSLPPQYGPFQINYNAIDEKWTSNELTSKLVQEESRLGREGIRVAIMSKELVLKLGIGIKWAIKEHLS
ncbi:unnamed protein product [Microthlaspi erraticum]|uniref:BAH domain-containing protein n=1 Tax=Microthlaspi erraticum TaxID=1685480 RepID=A0A6D2IVM8_9BRAS|nr:unnamed protein product [Microthlaspi erraticum]